MKLSYTMNDALRTIKKGDVYYDSFLGRIHSRPMIAWPTIEALEKRDLVEIDYKNPIPGSTKRHRQRTFAKYPIVLTKKGAEACP